MPNDHLKFTSIINRRIPFDKHRRNAYNVKNAIQKGTSNMLLSPAFLPPLLGWYERNKRDLPWRRDREPYHVWLSEIMLQQTRVEAVKGYYARFLAELPDIPKATILRIFIQSYIQDRNVDMQLRNWKNAYTSTLNLWNLLTNLQFMIFSFSV